MTRVLYFCLFLLLVFSTSVSASSKLTISARNFSEALQQLSQQSEKSVAVDLTLARQVKDNSDAAYFNYTGNSFEDALRQMCIVYDLRSFVENDQVFLTAFETTSFAVPVAMSSNFTAVSGDTTTVLAEPSEKVKKFAEYLKTLLSEDGRLSLSPSGVVTVTDHPSRVKDFRKMFKAEAGRFQPLTYTLRLVKLSKSVDKSKATDEDWKRAKVVREWAAFGTLGSTMPMTETIDGTTYTLAVSPSHRQSNKVFVSVYFVEKAVSSNSPLFENLTTTMVPIGGQTVLAAASTEQSLRMMTKSSSKLNYSKDEFALVLLVDGNASTSLSSKRF